MRHRRRSSCRGDRGAVLVEAAFVLPVFMLLICGVIDFGLFFSGSATTTSTARDASRYASANFASGTDQKTAADSVRDVVSRDLSALTNQDTPVKMWIYKADANGYPLVTGNLTTDCTQSCYRYNYTGGAWVYDGTSPGWTNPSACLTYNSSTHSYSSLDTIGIFVQVKHNYVTGFLTKIVGATTTISERATSRLEPLPLSDSRC